MNRHAPLLALLVTATASAQTLPGTDPWNDRGDTKAAASSMVEGLHRFLDHETAATPGRRAAGWKRDTSSAEAFETSAAASRARLEKILGAVDRRVAPVEVQLVATTDRPAVIADRGDYRVMAVRWTVYDDVMAEGLLLEPKGEPRAGVVVLGDCETTPEQVAGLSTGLEPDSQVARVLAEAGCRVLVPTLLDRTSEFSGSPTVRQTNLSHREWIWRMGFETGRSPIGYEVDFVRAGVDWLEAVGQERPIGVAGYGEGGRVALYAAALDPRVDAVWIAGAFGPREGTWSEPIDRGQFGLLEEFGDAEVLSLVRGARLVEVCQAPKVDGPPPAVGGRADAASGTLASPGREAVRAEFERYRAYPQPTDGSQAEVIGSDHTSWNEGGIGSKTSLARLGLEAPATSAPPSAAPILPDSRARQGRLVRALSDHTQRLLRTSELRRFELWKAADRSSVEAYSKSVEPLREQLWTQVLGKFPTASERLAARSVKVYDTPAYEGYAIELPVWPDVVASGILLMPKGMEPGEKRPVVVCQHGLEGTPDEVTDPGISSPYHGYGARLAERGYIVYAPQNPYIGHDRFRQLQRKAHPLGKSLFGLIVRQHERTLEWLKSRPEVDPSRIAFYGLSYGGKSAMRLPAILKDYCLSICSADFNEWVVKCTNVDRGYSYMFTVEYDMYEWDLAGGFNYAEMAGLIAPRPFQVERGHDDGVAPDEWIGYEFAKVKERYDRLGLADRVGITYFNGPHEIRGEGTFEFLDRHLGWKPRGPGGG